MPAKDPFGSVLGAAYSAYMERPWLSRPIGRVLWGGDCGPFYDSMSVVSELPPGATVVDCPAGAGAAFRAIGVDQEVDFVAVDRSPAMLGRARDCARRRAISQVRFVEADAARLPLDDTSTDLFLAYWGLHCFDDPAGSLREARRITKPGAPIVGATFVRGDAWRQRLMFKPGRGAFGEVAYREEVERWICDAGFVDLSVDLRGPMLHFTARAGARAAC